jgi:D-alanine--poly(phosphoribitol) ligase subunit 1
MLSDRFRTLFNTIRSKGEASAIIGHDERLSWAALGRRIGAIHAALLRSETPPGTPVLLQGHKECDLVAAMIASALAGRAFVFADQSYPEARVAQVVEACGCALALCSLPDMPDSHLPRIDLFTLPDAPLPEIGLDPTDEATGFYITFTSGSTGVPKGIPIRRSSFDAFMAWFEPLNTRSAGGGGAHVAHASLAFDMSMSDIWTTLFAGRSLYLLHHQNTLNPRANLRQMLSAPDAIPGTLTATPAFFQLMLEDSRFSAETLPQLKSFWVGGEAVPKPMLRRLCERFPGCEIYHAYGPSEVTCITHSHRLQPADLVSDAPLPLGGEQPGLLVRVDDGSGVLKPQGEGEVVLLGPQVAEGYLPRNHPANVQFGRHEGLALYRTGDFGSVDALGCLTIRGRIDAQVKINGHRVELGEIERIAAQVPGVALAVALQAAEASPNRGLILVLNCEGAGDATTEAAKIAAVRAHLKTRLPGWMVPARIVASSDLPVQISGKIDRRAARERFGMV